MAEFIFSLCLLLGAFVVLSLLGHWCWLGITKLFTLLLPAEPPARQCTLCEQPLGQDGKCPSCANKLAPERVMSTARPTPSDDVAAARRLIQYARFRQWLPDEQLDSLGASLEGLSQRLAEEAPVATAEVLPIAASTPEPFAASQSPSAFVAHGEPPTATSIPAVHPLDAIDDDDVISQPAAQPAASPAAAHVSAPQRLTADILRAFMERSNIRWIELISAALVVVCSVGLVISLWSTLSRTSRFFPSLVFLLATLAVHGAGQYTLQRWKLRTTSRGILHIGLMLIPLSMLVGILLSRRGQEIPELTAGSWIAVAVVASVYSVLAVTASRSLFSRRYLPVALVVIGACLTLVPVYFYAARGASARSAAALLVPLATLSAALVMYLAWLAAQRRSWTASFARRHLGMAFQVLFAVVTACVFSYLQSRARHAISPWWWTQVGLVAVGWAGWAWSISLPRLARPWLAQAHARANSVAASGMIVAAWIIGLAASAILLASLWQTSLARPSLIVLLASAAVWWCIQGGLCRLPAGVLVGALAAIAAAAIGAETLRQSLMHASVLPLSPVDWISLERTTWLAGFAALAAVIAAVAPRWDDRLVRRPLLTAAALGIIASAGLTCLASFVNAGRTPYGGNWAPISLTIYGVAIMAAGIAAKTRPATGWLMPIGQALTTLAAVRFCQTSSLVPEWLVDLRPGRAWGVGLAIVAALWSSLAASLRAGGLNRLGLPRARKAQTLAIDWLCGGAIALAAASSLAIWRLSDRLLLASEMGWTLPLVAIGVWWAWRQAAARELGYLAAACWLWAGCFVLGDSRAWWSTLGMTGSVAAHALVAQAFCLLVVSLQAQSTAPRFPRWIGAGVFWAIPTILILCLVGITASAAWPAAQSLAAPLGLRVVDPEQLGAAGRFAFQPPAGVGILCVLAALALCVPTFFLASRLSRDLLWLRSAAGILPLSLALAAAAATGSAWSLVSSTWTLAACLLASEAFALCGRVWREQSDLAWIRQIDARTGQMPEFSWLAVGRSIAFAALLGLTLSAVVQAWRGSLGAEVLPAAGDSDWSALGPAARGLHLLVWLGPLLSVALVRWWLSVAGDAPPRLSNLSAGLAALAIACCCSLSVTNATDRWVFVSVAFVQAAAASLAVLAGLTAAVALLRNAVALSALLPASTPWSVRLEKSCKGGRWKRAEASAWSQAALGLVLLAVLCIAAAITNVWSSVSVLPASRAIATAPSLLAFAAVLTIFVALARWRRWSAFELSAIGLGLLAPLVATFYTQWLDAAPGRRSATAQGFEAYRAQLVLWLAALALGLGVRLGARDRRMSTGGEALWIGLAGIVGALGLIATAMDPEKPWPAALLSGLALVTALSGAASGQTWRGHVAAVTAAIAIVTYVAAPSVGVVIEIPWLMLWGPVWVATCTLLWTIAHQARHRESDLAGATDDQLPITATASGQRRAWLPSVDQTASVHVPVVISCLSGVYIAVFGQRAPLEHLPWIVALGVAAWALAVGRLWDWRRGQRGLAVYLATLSLSLTCAVTVVGLAGVAWREGILLWMAAGLLAMAIMAGCLREWLRESQRLLPALRLGALAAHTGQFLQARSWMVPLHAAIGLALLVPCVLLVLDFDQPHLRSATAALPLLSALSILPIAVDPARRLPRSIGLALIVCSAVLCSWSDLRPLTSEAAPGALWDYLQRTFASLVFASLALVALAEPLRHKIDWQRILHRASWLSLAAGCFCGIAMLAGAAAGDWADVWRNAPLGSKLVTLAAWCASVVRCLLLAMAPRGLDTRASTDVRHAAVYLAEIGLGLLVAATYYGFPDLFGGIFARWWPLVVFAIAMLSAALGQLCARAGHRVLADPVMRSSVLLTLIPLFALWWPGAPLAGAAWREPQRFSLLLLIAASLIGLHGWLRPSRVLAALAAGLTFLSYWTLLYSQPHLRFLQHPQFWLLPPAIATLAFVELNRARLHASVVVASRYAAVLIAYLSSTAELLLKAFEGQLWQPLVLLALAIAGVLLGIALRVRAFLYCGSVFILVALLGMVWHAQQAIEQVWPWWAFGILTGITLIAMLGYFEKNRPKVLAYLEQLKGWEH